jgi:taurine---2-oxoglutarate transaminase
MDPAEARRLVRETNFVTWRKQSGWNPLLIARAEGSRFFDESGKSYLDMSSQVMATNLGHGNAAVAEAIGAQARELAYAGPSFATFARARLSAALDAILPPGLRRYFFATSGTEANEAALKIARLVTGRRKVLSRYRSYHGSTAGSISVTGDFRRGPAEGLHTVPGTVFAPDCYCYRCPLGLEYPDCGVACAEFVDGQLEHEPDVAAMILEPVVGTNGVIPPVPEYLPKIREITRKHGVLLIADEVMSGWGRVGEWFAVDRWKVVPDMITTAKGITGAMAPLGLTATTPAIQDAFAERYFAHGHTYGAHPVSLAAGAAAIGEYHRLGLIERSRREGEYLARRLREIASRHPSVGEARSIGLFGAVELVKDRDSKTPLNTPEEKLAGKPLIVDSLQKEAMEKGVYFFPWVSHLVIAPPLIITREELDLGLSVLDDVLKTADAPTPGTAG